MSTGAGKTETRAAAGGIGLSLAGVKRPRAPERDLVAAGVAAAAIILFLGTGGSVLPDLVREWSGDGPGPDKLLVNALLLNIALMILGWRRHAELTTEVRERRRAEERAFVLALTDPLTGCLNRRGVGPATDELIAVAAARGQAVAFMMFDLDRFKSLNDMNGHSAGDAMLIETARRVHALLPGDAVLARLGGDEFACALIYDPARQQAIDRLAERMIDEIARPVEHGGLSMRVTVSIGLVGTDENRSGNHRWDAQALLHSADIAMYHAKKRGRNCFYWFEAAMESELRLQHRSVPVDDPQTDRRVARSQKNGTESPALVPGPASRCAGTMMRAGTADRVGPEVVEGLGSPPGGPKRSAREQGTAEPGAAARWT